MAHAGFIANSYFFITILWWCPPVTADLDNVSEMDNSIMYVCVCLYLKNKYIYAITHIFTLQS